MIDERGARLAAAYLQTGRADRALDELAPLLAAEPDDADLLLLGASASAAAGRIDDARELAARATANAPDDVAPLLVRSRIESLARRSADAARAAAAAVRMAPDDWRAHAQVVRVDLAAAVRYRTTAEAVRTMLRLAPQQPEARVVAGWYEVARRRPKAARVHFAAALALDPTDGAAQEGLAHLAAGRLDFRPVVETAGARLAADPTDGVGTRLLDLLVRRLGVPALIGPPLIALVVLRVVGLSDDLPAGTTVAASTPFLLALPPALLAWLLLQAVLLHRATGGRIWSDLRSARGFRGTAAALVVSGLMLVSTPIAAALPLSTLRPAIVGACATWGLALLVPVLVGAAGGRGKRRPEPLPSSAVTARVRLLAWTALATPPLAAVVVIATSGGQRSGPASVPGATLLGVDPLGTVLAAAALLLGVLALAGAHRASGGLVRTASSPVRLAAAAVAATLTVGGTAWGLLLPVRAGTAVLLLLVLGWVLVALVGLLAVSRRQRLARR